MGAEDVKRDMIQRAVSGDAVALTVLLTESEDLLRRRLTPRIPSDLQGAFDVEDLLQEAYTDAFRAITAFEWRGEDSFDRWLCTVALQRLRMEIRRCRAARRGGGRVQVRNVAAGQDRSTVTLLDLMEAADRTPSREAAGQELVAAVQIALQQLPEDYQGAVRLVYLEGCPVAEAAQRLGCTERAVHNLCHRAKKKLRGLLGTRSRFLSSSD